MIVHNTMQVDVVDPEAHIFSGIVEYLVAPASEGEIGVYPNHIALISKLKPGLLRLQLPNQEEQKIFAISGGFLEVHANHVTVLADIVERSDKLDEDKLVEQKKLALEKIKRHKESSSDLDVAKAQASLELAIAGLKAIEYIKRHKK